MSGFCNRVCTDAGVTLNELNFDLMFMYYIRYIRYVIKLFHKLICTYVFFFVTFIVNIMVGI